MPALQQATDSGRAIRATAEVDGSSSTAPFLRDPVLVRGAGQQHSGLYYVESVTHRISRDEYTQIVGWRNAVGLTGAEIFADPFAAA